MFFIYCVFIFLFLKKRFPNISGIVFVQSSVMWQKGKSQKGGNKKTKRVKYSEKRTFLTI